MDAKLEGIHAHGYWYGEKVIDYHFFDSDLAMALVEFFKLENDKTVVDFGCGVGEYVKVLLKNQIHCEGYDGHPEAFKFSNGLAKTLDLSQECWLKKQFDWVLSLEVGEHIPQKYEKTFIDNLHKHALKGIILSWAVKGQGGFGHFNEQNNQYIKDKMAQYGYKNDVNAENNLRNKAMLSWFKNTIMVFRKRNQ